MLRYVGMLVVKREWMHWMESSETGKTNEEAITRWQHDMEYLPWTTLALLENQKSAWEVGIVA